MLIKGIKGGVCFVLFILFWGLNKTKMKTQKVYCSNIYMFVICFTYPFGLILLE